MGVNCIDYAILAVSNTAVGLASATPAMTGKTQGVIVTVETDQVRWRADGTAPTSTEGHLMNTGDVLSFDSWTSNQNWRSVLTAIRFIRVTTDATLKISYFD